MCGMSRMALIATGAAMPGVHRVIHGVFSTTSVVAYMGLAVKLLCIAAMACDLYFGPYIFNPKLKAMSPQFAGYTDPDRAQAAGSAEVVARPALASARGGLICSAALRWS